MFWLRVSIGVGLRSGTQLSEKLEIRKYLKIRKKKLEGKCHSSLNSSAHGSVCGRTIRIAIARLFGEHGQVVPGTYQVHNTDDESVNEDKDRSVSNASFYGMPMIRELNNTVGMINTRYRCPRISGVQHDNRRDFRALFFVFVFVCVDEF